MAQHIDVELRDTLIDTAGIRSAKVGLAVAVTVMNWVIRGPAVANHLAPSDLPAIAIAG